MSAFVVEHRNKGNYRIEIVSGTEDLDTSQFEHILGIWVCDDILEATTTIAELWKMRGQNHE